MSHLLYGHNTDERIVAVHQDDDRTMRLYFRDPDGIRSEAEPFFPFLYLSDENYLEGFPKKHWIKQLSGTGFYRFLAVFEEWAVLWEAIRFVLDRYNRDALTKATGYQDLDQIYFFPDPVTQYLMQTGRTLFKGMRFEDLHRLQLDIETYTTPPYRFSNAAREGDRIILIALTDNRGWQMVLDGHSLKESDMLRELGRIIGDRDPDVIEGHNIMGFDFPYVIKRAELHNVPLTLGRNGATLRSFEARSIPGERSFAYALTDVPGRHIVDTFTLVQNYDASRREMESHGLKAAAQYFGVARPDRTYVPSDRISWYWDHEPDTLGRYALDDALEAGEISSLLSHAAFYLTQMLPFNYGQVVRLGSAMKIETLMVREYLREKQALPKPQQGAQTTGGYTDVFITGVIGPVLQMDIESLYPSVMLTNRISPLSDEKTIFLQLLDTLTTMRLKAKRALRRAGTPQERAHADALQSSLKILINSFYGYLGYARGLFNDYEKADLVTRTGQSLLREMIVHLQAAGGQVVEADTDGVFVVPPHDVDTREKEEQFVSELGTSLPSGIVVALQGRYQTMLSYKKKNYALLGYDNKIEVKGSSLSSRLMERFGREYIREAIECVLRQDVGALHALYIAFRRRIVQRELNVTAFSRVETLRDSLADYSTDVALGKRTRSAAYEVGLMLDRPLRPGDRVAYYVTGADPNPRTFEHCKPAEAWDPNFPDENTSYYLRRLEELSEKFKPFFTPKDYRAIFSDDDLFPFSPEGMTILTTRVPAHITPEADETLSTDFGIWLDE
jgi:DNA polymerase I